MNERPGPAPIVEGRLREALEATPDCVLVMDWDLRIVSEPSCFTPEHEEMVRTLAAQASVAEENAILYKRLWEAKAELDLNEFSYSVAHALRAPLRAIVSTGRILLEDAAERLTRDERELLDLQAANGSASRAS